MRELVLAGPQRYNTLLSRIQGISAKELTRNLRELEAVKLITLDDQDSTKLYALTPLGLEIEEPFRALGIFGTALAAARNSYLAIR